MSYASEESDRAQGRVDGKKRTAAHGHVNVRNGIVLQILVLAIAIFKIVIVDPSRSHHIYREQASLKHRQPSPFLQPHRLITVKKKGAR
jgi:hypothetical protein